MAFASHGSASQEAASQEAVSQEAMPRLAIHDFRCCFRMSAGGLRGQEPAGAGSWPAAGAVPPGVCAYGLPLVHIWLVWRLHRPSVQRVERQAQAHTQKVCSNGCAGHAASSVGYS